MITTSGLIDMTLIMLGVCGVLATCQGTLDAIKRLRERARQRGMRERLEQWKNRYN